MLYLLIYCSACIGTRTLLERTKEKKRGSSEASLRYERKKEKYERKKNTKERKYERKKKGLFGSIF
jgi:hypothetical protein